ncbi:hypothetical protein NG895_26710 [Aeoliella sp. ICT_H6.2]|uniref:Uncharacterized protein n=1 Tax=Aeoliella straminimaris TaxID=2954799 RepID=A0A9X2FIS6_9BACT|nr:hypothetical protein [Aeoliella straminimaris]MCO6047511.1 hypothetical protein [Aeoliella straminimaris]
MSDKSEQLAWRETYFVMFSSSDRPTLAQVEAAIAEASSRLSVSNLEANDEGLFTSAVVQAPEDNAAMEISYEAGDLVVEQSGELAKQLRKQLDGDQLAQLVRADARLDVMHFERLAEGPDDYGLGEEEDEESLLDEALDPASLITVVDALARLTGGIAFDPASGDIMA